MKQISTSEFTGTYLTLLVLGLGCCQKPHLGVPCYLQTHFKPDDGEKDVESYELPDGRTIEVGAERFQIPEILFSPSMVQLTRGTASVPQLKERLQKDVHQRSSSHQVKVLTRPGKQAYYSVWVGGSLLASLGSFERMWLTKKEFEDHGYVKAEEKWEFYKDV